MINDKEVTKLLSYMSTFDGGLYKRNKNAYFSMNMREANRDYVEWVCEVLNTFVSAKIKPRNDVNTDGYSREPQVNLLSKSHPKLTTLHSRIYIGNHKVIDPHMLKLMDAETLAIIFMADGCARLDTRPKNPHGSIQLFTCGFSYADNMSLSKAIFEKLGIRTNVRKHGNYWKLAVPSKDVITFCEVVTPYLCDSFLYKIERIAPYLLLKGGEEIVWTVRERTESHRNDVTLPAGK